MITLIFPKLEHSTKFTTKHLEPQKMKKKRKKLKIPRRREPETIGLDFILYVVVL